MASRDHRRAALGRAAVAIMSLFGEDMPDVVRFCGEIFEEAETRNASLLSPIVRRINDHRSSPADLAWLLVQAEVMSGDLIYPL